MNFTAQKYSHEVSDKLSLFFLLPVLFVVMLGITNPRAYGEDAPEPGNFGFRQIVTPLDSAPVQFFDLPEAVYTHTASRTLADVRMFNRAGVVIPFELTRLEDTVSRSAQRVEAPLFPIAGAPAQFQGAEGQAASAMDIDVKQDNAGNILSVHLKGAEWESGAPASSVYLVDLRNIKHPIDSFWFEWTGPSGQIVPVSISTSGDLKSWSETGSGVLAKLEYQGRLIDQSEIHAPFNGGEFARITVRASGPVTIQKIFAQYETIQTTSRAESVTKVTPTETAPLKVAYEYDSRGGFPSHSFHLDFGSQNILANVTLSSRPTSTDAWIERFKGPLYSINIQGTPLESTFHSFPAIITDRYWKVESNEHEFRFEHPPILELKWRHQTVRYLAQGGAPFTLAYGDAKLASFPTTGQAIASIADESTLSKIESKLDDMETVRGPEALVLPAPDKPIQWHKWALWAVLVLILGMLVAMAIKLVRELRET